mgnify:CR=1 FL=1
MTKIAKQLTELVGNTPLLELNKYSQAKGLDTAEALLVQRQPVTVRFTS